MSTSQKKAAPAPAQTEEKAGFKPKKSVALSGVVAGNTALCTVGRTGNDLHYAAMTSWISPTQPSSKRSLTCWCTANCPTRPN